MPLKPNTPAPDFSLKSTNGGDFQLSVTAANQPVILYFYPKDFTRVCTKEACSFRDNFEVFKNLDIMIAGISTDNSEQHARFKEAYELPFELLSDITGNVSKLYKAYVPVMGISKRVTYLLDKEHRIRHVYSDLFGAESHIKSMIKKLEGSN